jgi:hypothetical protein
VKTLDWERMLEWPSLGTRQRWAGRYGWAGGPYPEDEEGRVLLEGARVCRSCGEGLYYSQRSDAVEHPECRVRRKSAQGRLRRRMRATPVTYPSEVTR